MNIELNISPKEFSSKFYPYLLDFSHRFECYMGSSGSGKSYFIVQKLIVRACREKINILACRRYGTTIRNSVFSLFKEILGKWQLLPYVKIRETDFEITFPNGSRVIFLGLDDENKLLSINNISCIFIEEAFEVPKETVDQLNLRMRGSAANQQIIMAWNPISKSSWLYDFCEVNPPENLLYIHSTYLDNSHLPKEYVDALEELKVRNPRKAEVYCYGRWGVDAEGLVLTNWKEEMFNPMEIAARHGIERRCGLDIGWTDPTAIVDTLYDKENHIIYVYNQFYRSGQTLDKIAAVMETMNLKKVKVACDAADPRAISFFREKGFNTYPCVKGQGSVEARISFLQNNQIIVLPKCQDVLNELGNFSYIKDKKTEKYTDKTTHEFSHSIDALGYAYSDIYTNKQLKSFDKKLLGIR